MPFSLVAGKADIPLFVFGSLIDQELLACVLGHDTSGLKITHAHAPGFSRVFAENENYPILIEKVGSDQKGLLIEGLSEYDLARLQFYETCEYALQPIKINREGEHLSAQVFRHTAEIEPSDRLWSFDYWQQEDKPLVLVTTKEAMEWFGKVDLNTFEVMWDEIEEKARQKLLGVSAA